MQLLFRNSELICDRGEQPSEPHGAAARLPGRGCRGADLGRCCWPSVRHSVGAVAGHRRARAARRRPALRTRRAAPRPRGARRARTRARSRRARSHARSGRLVGPHTRRPRRRPTGRHDRRRRRAPLPRRAQSLTSVPTWSCGSRSRRRPRCWRTSHVECSTSLCASSHRRTSTHSRWCAFGPTNSPSTRRRRPRGARRRRGGHG